MKKLLLFMFAAFAFAACEQTPIEEQSSVLQDAPETLTVGFEGDDTRIQLNESQKTVWTKGDLVSVFYRSNANQQWKYDGETGARTANLKRVDAGTATRDMDRVVVVYPYNEDYYINPSTFNVQASLPATQHYLANSYGLDGNIMISSAEYNDVTLKNVCGWLKLQLTGDGEVVKSITFKGNNGEQVAGELYINSAEATAILASDMGNIAEDDGNNATGGAGANLSFDDVVLKEVTLDCYSAITLGAGVTLGAEATAFYIALPPQTFTNGFTVKVVYDDYRTMTITTSNPINIERNHIQPMAAVKTKYDATKMDDSRWLGKWSAYTQKIATLNSDGTFEIKDQHEDLSLTIVARENSYNGVIVYGLSNFSDTTPAYGTVEVAEDGTSVLNIWNFANLGYLSNNYYIYWLACYSSTDGNDIPLIADNIPVYILHMDAVGNVTCEMFTGKFKNGIAYTVQGAEVFAVEANYGSIGFLIGEDQVTVNNTIKYGPLMGILKIVE